MHEYNGIDIRTKIDEEQFSYVFKVGNHEFTNYTELRKLIKKILLINRNNIPMILDSLTNLEITTLEKCNYIATLGYNKRVFDYCAIVCALKDSNYDFDEFIVNNKNLLYYDLDKIVYNMEEKKKLGFDTMINNPIDFRCKNGKITSDKMIDGIDLCRIMEQVIQPMVKNSTLLSPKYNDNVYKTLEKIKEN